MTILKRLISIGALLALAACGGGDGGGTPFGGPGTGTPTPGTPTTPTTPTAADLTLSVSSATIQNSGAQTATVTVSAVDANRNTVTGIPVTIAVDSDATVAVSGTVTDATGVVTGTVGIGANRSNRTITITATSGTLTRQATVQVVGTLVTGTPVPAVLSPGQAGVVQYRVVDATGNPMAALPITILGVGGVQTLGTTGLNGDYNYAYTAPAAAATLEIRASAGGFELTTTVIVQSGSGSIPPAIAGSVRSSSVSANPSVVGVNTATTTTNRAEVRALFVGSNNAPVQNVRVRFDLNGDPNSIGGSFTTGENLVYSNSSGIATSAYVPGTRFSPTDGVTIRACWDYNDFAVGNCPNSATATLTVISDALSVSIGTDELITLADLTYVKRFVVQVNDSSGLAKPDVLVSPLLDLPIYLKGFWTRPGNEWVKTTTAAACGNEDLNRNGVLEDYGNGNAEDANLNASLDPRKADVAVAFEGSNRTNAAGQVVLRVTYPRNVASWVQFNLVVAAAGVSGTEGRASFSALLPVPAAAITAQGAPAFVASPYGVEVSGLTLVTAPDGTSAFLCTNPN
jgi:hypothetical protein